MTEPNPYRGKGAKAYRRRRDALERQARATNARCPVCGEPYDFANPNGPHGFTADHDDPLGAGGRLLGPITGKCRSCNSRRGKLVTPTLRPPS